MAVQCHGVEPEQVDSVDAAWDAFREFLDIEIDGIEDVENDGDGFIAEWGNWSWNDGQPTLSFGRLMAVSDSDDRSDPYWQPEYWKLELDLCFAGDPAWADLDRLGTQNTGFDFTEIGPARAAVLAEMRGLMESYPALQAVWRATPIRSRLSLERAG